MSSLWPKKVSSTGSSTGSALKKMSSMRQQQQASRQQDGASQHTIKINVNLTDNLEYIKTLLQNPNDLVTRQFTAGSTQIKCAVVFIDGLVNQQGIDQFILNTLQHWGMMSQAIEDCTSASLHKDAVLKAISVGEVRLTDSMDDAVLACLSGETLLFVDGEAQAIIMGVRGWEKRAISEPESELTIRGPRDGFIENLRTNIVLIRRRIRDPHLRIESYKIGRRAKIDFSLLYLDGIVNPDLVKEVKRRLETIDMDDAPDISYIEHWIQDSFLSPFPQLQNTERPDKVASGIIQGKVAILQDGSPSALILPLTFSNQLHSSEDYYDRWMAATALRILRYICAFTAVFLPGLYIALVEYHQGMIPSKLAFSIASTREGVPFPAYLEALIMEVTLEILREAGLRLPKPLGQTVGIVGGLVIGEAAVSAGIVSPIMVIVVALTAIASFAMPTYSVGLSLRLLRFFVMLSAAFFGFYGIVLIYIMINIHLTNLQSFGVPYSTPYAPTLFHDFKDLIWRAPLTMNEKRPEMFKTQDVKRIDKEGEKNS